MKAVKKFYKILIFDYNLLKFVENIRKKFWEYFKKNFC